MKLVRIVFVLLLAFAPFSAPAAVTKDDLPADTVWYLHADIEQMRDSDSGKGIYSWLDEEVFVEFHEEVGVDLGKEVDRLTAFSSEPDGTVILIEGPVSQESRESLLALARKESEVTEHKHGRLAYFFVKGDEHSHDDDEDSGDDDESDSDSDDDDDHHGRKHRNNISVDLEDGLYVSFALRNKLLITGNEPQMKELLDNKGKIAGNESHDGALFVLTADKSFVQAGLNTNQLDDEDSDSWDSNIIRNTEQAAVMISDFDGNIAIEAKLVSTDKEMAQALGGIANGLIAMQAFNSDIDENVKNIIANTKIEVVDNVLSISTVLAPDLIVDALSD